jgi:predicted phosphodiesterase
MKIAVLSDIHSNHIALQACMDYIYKNDFDGIAFLGDYVSDFPYPQKTMRILRSIPQEYKTWFVRGNREDYMLNHRLRLTENWEYSSQSGSLLYTYENLTGSDLRFFEAMPIGMEIKQEGYPPFSICHGSMQNSSALFYGDSPLTREVMSEMTNGLLLCGHCHLPYEFMLGSKTIVNVGSVGNPVNGHTEAQFVEISSDGGEWKYTRAAVPFDVRAATEEFYESGLSEKADVWSRCCIAALREGKNYNYECVKLVRKLSCESGKPFGCEELWQQAAEQLNI